MTRPETQNCTRLLLASSSGEKSALDRLVPLVYSELRRLASAYLRRERTGHTLQTTELVHEAYLRLIDQAQVRAQDRAHFVAIAANLMRQVLIRHAERRGAAKRGSGNTIALEDADVLTGKREVDLVALNHAMEKLERVDPRQSRIVELRFFGGLTEEEIADAIGISATTVKREWRTAKLMLYRELKAGR